VEPQSDAIKIEMEKGGRKEAHFVDAVIIATGGLIGGGMGLRHDGGFPPVLGPTLAPLRLSLSGATFGWDARADGGRWIRPPHATWRPHDVPRIAWAGDVETMRRDEGRPAGTVLSAVISGKRAVDRLFQG
jgi:hypothetical protein